MNKILSEEFLSKYKEVNITPLSNIGEFVYLRTYSRYLEEKKRRENWFETVLRTTEYNIELGISYKKKHGLFINMKDEIKEGELLFDNLFNGNIGMNINIVNLFVNIVIIYYVLVLLKKIYMKVRKISR